MRQLFLDVDGVMADFHTAATALFGFHAHEAEERIGTNAFWKTIHSVPAFFEDLAVMPDAMELYSAVEHLHPILLTGCKNSQQAKQKLRWRDQKFPGVPMITCQSKDKRKHAKPGDVLVDDWLKWSHLWVEMGGIFIHHKSAKESIEALKEYFEL